MSDYTKTLAAARKTGVMQQTDAQAMAAFCDSTAQILLGAVSPELIWAGAQRKGLTTRQLTELIHGDPDAARDLMWL